MLLFAKRVMSSCNYLHDNVDFQPIVLPRSMIGYCHYVVCLSVRRL